MEHKGEPGWCKFGSAWSGSDILVRSCEVAAIAPNNLGGVRLCMHGGWSLEVAGTVEEAWEMVGRADLLDSGRVR